MGALLAEWKSAKKTFKKAAAKVAKKKNPGLDLESLEATLEEMQKKSGLTPALKAVESAEGKGPDAFEDARKKYAAAADRYRGLLAKGVVREAKQGGQYAGLKKALEEMQGALDEIQVSIDARDKAAGSWQQADEGAPKKRSALDRIGDALKGALSDKERDQRIQKLKDRVNAISHEGIYQHKGLWKAFHEYNVKGFSDENTLFYQMHQQGAFKSIQGKRDAYTTFLKAGAPKELNLTGPLRKAIDRIDDVTRPEDEERYWRELDLDAIARHVLDDLHEVFTRFTVDLNGRIEAEIREAEPAQRRAALAKWEKRIP